MSTFYGNLLGSRGEATRCGTANSGIRAAVRSYHGSCITELQFNRNDELVLSIDTADDSRSCWGDRKYYGSLENFNKLMDAVKQVGVDEAIKVLSRKARK